MRNLRIGCASLLVVSALALGACGGAADGPATAEGVVRGVDRQKSQITIQHGDIPGLMKAMTMSFDVSDPSMLEGVKAGDQISFHVRHADGRYTVTALEPR